jgi:putative membrane-bound dehydrogenase-like protein
MVAIERDHPGAVALIGIGCGADMNPIPRGTEEITVQHGEEIAAEVARLLKTERRPVRAALTAQVKDLTLPLASPPSREELKLLAASTRQNIAYAAKQNLARLDRGEELSKQVPYQVQSWTFGEDLAMIFLPGEVTVDYQLRLKMEFDSTRLWVNAYSNDAPCYIPSRKVLAEGGYEGENAMVYYDQPAKFAPGAEERIVAAVHEIVPEEFLASYRADLPPKSPSDSLAAIEARDDLGIVVELAAAEPFVADPVAIDWDVRGRMWVVEQPDYPNGMDGNWQPGGRVKILSDNDGDGRYERADLLLEGIPFPTGITCWGKGAYVCAAPDILYVEDTTGDGKADKVDKLFSGFHTDNYNARINSLTLGLDSWIHGANGLLGGNIRNEKTGELVDIRGRDVRFHPDTLEFDLVSGVTQQGRVRDDWDNWFGCSNSRWIFHFPLPEQCVRRNPHVTAPGPSLYLPEKSEAKLNAISQPLERFNNPDAQGHITSACGLGIYRDELLGDEFSGNVFIGETAHNLVRRYQFDATGATFAVRRPAGEEEKEFFASADNWTRPVQIRTGPDGALYIVDMYRAVIEHTRWIPADRLAKIDPRAGEGMGRIYRLVPGGTKLRKVSDLSQLEPVTLVAALDSPNGTTRDLVHQQLLLMGKQGSDLTTVHGALANHAANSKWPAVRVQALAILDGLEMLSSAELLHALADSDARLRRHALRLVAPRIADTPELADATLRLVDDPDFTVRYQLALALGDWDDPAAAKALGDLAVKPDQSADKWFRGAVVSSSLNRPLEILEPLLAAPRTNSGRTATISALIATAAATASESEDFETLNRLLTPQTDSQTGARPLGWQMIGVAQVLDALERRKMALASLANAEQVRPLFEAAHRIAADGNASEADRQAALRLFGRGFNDPVQDVPLLSQFLRPSVSDPIQKTALAMLAQSSRLEAAEAMLSDWSLRAPSMRASIITTLLARDSWTERLLNSVEDGVISPAEITASNRQSLEAHRDEEIRQRTRDLLPVADNSERAAVVAKYQAVADLQGDAVHGATVFKTACAVCHDYLGQGRVVGPNLKAYYNKSVSDFVTAILDPNAAVEPRYVSYAITTRDQRSLIGVIASESAASLEVIQPGGIRETILRTEIEGIHATGVSLMPDGLEQAITPQHMADLIAYLKSGG